MRDAGIAIPSPRDMSWGEPPMPMWVEEFRPAQIEAVEIALDAYRSGRRVVLAEMPTGSGKSLTAEILRRILKTRAVYMVSTKQLQQQIEDWFDYAAVLWGRRNYPTRDKPNYPIVDASMCDKSDEHVCDNCFGEYEGKMGCSLCHPVFECPYEIAKSTALRSKLTVLNYRYALTEMNFVGRFGEQRSGGAVTGRIPLAIADEADVLEEELMGFVQVSISARRQKQFGIAPPTRKTVERAFVEWTLKTEAQLKRVLAGFPTHPSPVLLKDREWVVQTLGKVRRLQAGLKDEMWVYDDEGGRAISFRPVKVDMEARRYLWRHADRWMLMSATICSPDVLAQDLGLEDDEWTSFSLPSSFDPARRPIYVVPRANMRQSAGMGEWEKMAEALATLLQTYEGDRVLVPTVSYKLNTYLMEQLPVLNPDLASRLVTYSNAASRQQALDRYRKQQGAVLLAPSMDRGLDLVDEDCRCVVIVKCPYPYLGDKQVWKRKKLPGGTEWYLNQAIRRMVQATGRAMRHADDWCDSWILDSAFVDLYAKHSRWFPRWWREAVDWTRGGREALNSRGGARQAAMIGEG